MSYSQIMGKQKRLWFAPHGAFWFLLVFENKESFMLSRNNRLHAKSTQLDQSFWTTEQIVQRLKLSNPRPLYMAKAQNQPYIQGNYLVFATGTRNRWWFCKIQPYHQKNLAKVETGL